MHGVGDGECRNEQTGFVYNVFIQFNVTKMDCMQVEEYNEWMAFINRAD